METQSAIPVTSVTHHQMEPDAHDIPNWLQEPQLPTPDDPRVPRSHQTTSNQLTTYTSLFETSLERIMGGTPIHTIVASDPRGIQLGRFLFWINRDATRKARYEEACTIAAEAMAHELTAIADGMDENAMIEDVQRSALRVKSRTYLMEKWSPQRYGDTRRVQIDQTTVTATAEDLARLSLADLKRMAYEQISRHAAQRDDTVVIEATSAPMGIEDAA